MQPLQVIIGPRSQIGAMVEDWSMVLHMGVGKASACHMILEAVCEMNVGIQALQGIACILKAAPHEVHI